MGNEPDRSEWLAKRQRGIGGSDAAVVCGLSKWKTRYELWMEKTSDRVVDHEPSEAMRWGTMLEPVIRQRYCEVTGKSVLVPSEIIAHPNHSWCLASLDGVTDDDRIFEAKTARSADGWGEDGSDEIPEYYQTQVQHYMAVTGAEAADVAVLIGASDFRVMTVEADKELQDLMLEREAEFWDLVQRKVAPDPETDAEVGLAFPVSRGDFAEASSEIANNYNLLKLLKIRAEAIDERVKQIQTEIKKAIGDRDGIKDGKQVLATWKSAKPSKRFDTKEFAKAHPDLYSEFLKESAGSRRFLIK